jgi:hypothetical protein
MDTRDLDPTEWAAFFDAFSRHYRDRPVTVDIERPGHAGGTSVIARRMPLVGISCEPHTGAVQSIEIIVGNSIDDDLVHVVNAPRRVRVGQISNGEDEVIVIDSSTDPTARIDFSKADAHSPERPRFQWASGDGI